MGFQRQVWFRRTFLYPHLKPEGATEHTFVQTNIYLTSREATHNWRTTKTTIGSYIHEIERGLLPVLKLACKVVDFLKEPMDLEEERDLHDQANKARQAVASIM